MSDVDTTWPFWIDQLGNTIYPGSIVAVATINGRSPQMVVARVERINRLNSRGEEITTRKYFEYDEPVEKTRYGGGTYTARGEYKDIPSCSITATPLMDARGFTRWSSRKGDPARKVTYSIPENILLVDFTAPEIEER